MQAMAAEAEVAEDRKGKGEAEVAEDAKRTRVRPMEDEGNGTMNEGNVAQSEGGDATPPPAKKARLLEDAEAAFVAEDEGALTQNDAEVAQVAEDEGNVAQSDGSDATPPPANKKRLLEGFWVLPFSFAKRAQLEVGPKQYVVEFVWKMPSVRVQPVRAEAH